MYCMKPTFFSSKIRLFISLILSFVWMIHVNGQGKLNEQAKKLVTEKTGVFVCTITDNLSHPLEYATITILNPKDSSLLTGGITDAQGICLVNAIPWGTYIARISYIGYTDKYIPKFSISKTNPVYQLSKQSMELSHQQIEGVTITAQKEMLQNNLDKKVFNVDKSMSSEGVTAIEVLENIPSVSVDVEGNISLRGSESVTILIDGRPTNLTLDQIPSSMIESVELITNPSARFEPDGVSGIINVVLKKKKEAGLNGMITLGTGISNLDKDFYFFGRNNASVNINYRYNKINVFANYDFRTHSRVNNSTLERESIYNNDTTLLNQLSKSTSNGMSHNVRTGIDYFIDKQNTLSFNVSYSTFKRFSESNTDIKNPNPTNSNIYNKHYTLNNSNNHQNQNISTNLYYKHNFNKAGRELIVDLYYTQRWGENKNESIEEYLIPTDRDDYYNNEQTNANNKLSSIQLDYVSPIGNGGRIECGYKFNFRYTNQKYSQKTGISLSTLTESISDANNYDYYEYINAAYFIYSNTIKEKFKYQVGLRGELANNIFSLSNVDTNSRSFYPHIFPTLHLVYDINKKHSVSLSYSMRVRRPNIYELNPYVNYSDRFNLSKGNPNLKPELTNSVELGYQFMLEKTSITANIFYRHRYQMISRYTELLNDSVFMTSFQNFDQAQSYGIELYVAQTIFKWWKVNVNGSFYQTLIDSRQEMLDQNLMNDWSWNVRGTFNFILPKDFDIQITANYRSPMLTTGSMGGFGWGGGSGQGRMDDQWHMDIGIKKLFLKKTLTLTVRVNDVFATRNSLIHTWGSDINNPGNTFDAYSTRKNDSRHLYISLSYKINNYRPKKDLHSGDMEDYEE